VVDYEHNSDVLVIDCLRLEVKCEAQMYADGSFNLKV